MAQPISNLPKVMERVANSIQASTQFFMKRAATAIGKTAVQSTRVDTGLARSNWVATLDKSFNRIIAPYNPAPKGARRNSGFGETANANGAIVQHRVAIAAFNLKFNRSIHITNNVRYIGFLNNGSPTTSPDLMFEKAIQAGRASLRGLKIKVVKVRK